MARLNPVLLGKVLEVNCLRHGRTRPVVMVMSKLGPKLAFLRQIFAESVLAVGSPRLLLHSFICKS